MVEQVVNSMYFLISVLHLSIAKEQQGYRPANIKVKFMRGGYRGIPKPKLASHLKRVPVNARIQQWMLDQLKIKGEVGIVLEDILIKAGFKYKPKK